MNLPPPFGVPNNNFRPNPNLNSHAPLNLSSSPFLQPSINPTWESLPRVSVPFSNFNNNVTTSLPPFSMPATTQTPLVLQATNDSFQYSRQNSSDLNESVRVFRQLISQAETAAKQISELVNLNSPAVDSELACCPFNSHHRMPPQYLFRHYLCCPSSPATVDLDVLSSLRYPNTLKSDKDLNVQTQLFKPLQGFESDTCISIEEEEGMLDCNFFYKEAPGVVNLTQQEIKTTFTLPSSLSIECVNLRSANEEIGTLGNEEIILLPSEIWALKGELATWNDLPSKYSFVVLESAMGLGKVKESEIIKWIILNSPAYGIIIDFPMTCHIFLLLNLCLKAISREAGKYWTVYGSFKDRRDSSENREVNKADAVTLIKTLDKTENQRTSYFDCPALLESAMWLVSQISILYGQAYGKSFVIAMLRYCFMCAGCALYTKITKDTTRISNVVEDHASERKINANANAVGEYSDFSGFIKEERIGDANFTGNMVTDASRFDFIVMPEGRSGDKHKFGDGIIFERKVFVSQVAAAVAALHERFLLEEKIKGLRHSRRLSKFQLLAEHEAVVRKAAEERGRRPNFKPILEHDGLIWQRSFYQDSKKHKTREELLAEERDYKRRRMSYRGKKVKRSPTEVLRDIIEGHMEEIKLAGGIGCFVKGAVETPQFPIESIPSLTVAESVQTLGSINSALCSRGERSSFRNNQGMQSDSMILSSKKWDTGNMNLQGMEYCRSRSPQMNSQSFFNSGNRLDKYEHPRDYHQDDGKDRHDRAIPTYNYSHNDDDDRHYSSSANRFHETHESKHDRRSQERKTDRSFCGHEGRHASRSHERHRSRSHERNQGGSHGRYESGGSHDRNESAHSYVSYESSHNSREHRRASKHDKWRNSTDNDLDTCDGRKSGRSKSTTKHRGRD